MAALRAMRASCADVVALREAPALAAFVAAILERRTSAVLARRGFENLQDESLIDVERILATPLDELAALLKPAGDARGKANRLHKFCRLLRDRFAGSAEEFLASGLDAARRELSSLNGIGVETADWLLLRGAGAATYPVDAGTRRILARHNWIAFDAEYDEVREHILGCLDGDPDALLEFSRCTERTSRDYCKTTPKCDGCPLQNLLPAAGPTCFDL